MDQDQRCLGLLEEAGADFVLSNQPTKEDPEILTCPYCGLEITTWFSPPERRGKKTINYQSLTHRLPACKGFQKRVDPDTFLAEARIASKILPERR